ncbi:MAG: hypothetical protein EPN14_10395 [Gallionella sp.]|nr:MAG: hypothetical protein EPN14_10395 [Gallionella sp.]
MTFIIIQFTHTAIAFEGYEHKKMGDLAMLVVQNICEEDKGEKFCAANWKQAISQLTPCKGDGCKPNPITYGDIVRCVDDYLVPEKMLSRKVDPKKQTDAGQNWLPVDRNELMLNPLLEHCDAGRGGELAAAHANHTHFQNDLLVALNLHHTAAIGFALQGENTLYGALVMNAIADHYLHDFFAPGHMVTPRSTLTDTASNSMHDVANDQGMMYQLAPNMTGLIIDKQHEKLLMDAMAAVSVQLVCRPSKLFKEFPPAFIYSRLETTDPDCSEDKEKRADDAVREALKSLSNMQNPLKLKGDGLLWRDDNGQGLMQRVLMLAVNVRSILDVMDANKNKQFTNSFAKVNWQYEPSKSALQVTGDENSVKKDGSSNRISRPGIVTKLPCASNPDCMSVGFGHGRYELENDGSRMTHDALKNNEEYKNNTFSTLIGFQYARESLTSGAHYGRNAYEAYLAPILYRDENWNVIPNFGLVWLHEGAFGAHGASFRTDFIVPNTETKIAPYIRRIKYPNPNTYEWKNSFGVRAEQGFTSFMTLFIGLGKDYGPSPNLGLEHGWMFTAGANFSLPFIRAKKLIGISPDNQ